MKIEYDKNSYRTAIDFDVNLIYKLRPDAFIPTYIVFIDDFLPLTDNSTAALQMLYPNIGLSYLEQAIMTWDKFNPKLKDVYYEFIMDTRKWR